ncbi:endoribonuclease MazF [Escherichia coli]|nr:endoribonuclease MazF [Escherichia coli]
MVSRYVPDMGDLIWVDFDPTKGSEQAGHRPAVVLSPFMYNNKTGMCLCVPYTTQSKGYPFEVVLSGQERDGVELVNDITPENLHENIDWGEPKDKEVW